MEYSLGTSPWPGVILWVILYLSDYYLTLYTARNFREFGHFQFEGSFELTPQFQKDIDALKPVSRRHLILLVLFSLIIAALWWLTMRLFYVPQAYLLYLGMFLLVEVGVHIRHLRNAALVREARKNGGIEGQIRYRHWFSYKMSAFEFYLFSALFFLVAVLTFSPLFLGGTLSCLAVGMRHSIMSRKAKSKSLQTGEALS